MKSALALVALLLLLPSAAAEGYDAHVGAMESSRACTGERTVDAGGSDDGQGTSEAWSYSYWDEDCTVDEDLLSARVSRDDETLAAAHVGERFEGDSWGWSTSFASTAGWGYTSADESRSGWRSRGAHAEALGEEAAVDVERCEGGWSTQGWTSESANNSSSSAASGYGERCEGGLFVEGAGQSVAQPVVVCDGWGYETRDQPSADETTSTNSTVDYRSCRAEAWVEVLGVWNGVTIWSGHAHDCRGAWNGTAHETRCSSWGGEWTSVHVGALYEGRDVAVPYDPYGLLLP